MMIQRSGTFITEKLQLSYSPKRYSPLLEGWIRPKGEDGVVNKGEK